MRKSKLSTSLGIVGGAPQDLAIIPPAAAAVAHATLPENSPILQKLLSDDEIAAIKEHRLREAPVKVRQHNHADQVSRDFRRRNIDKANRRREKDSKSSLERRRKDGEPFKLGRAAPLTFQEEAALLNKSGPLPETTDELIELEDKLNKSVENELSEIIEASKPRNQKNLPLVPEGEAGGVSLIANTLGVNPRQVTPRTRTRRVSSPEPVVLEKPSLEASASKEGPSYQDVKPAGRKSKKGVDKTPKE